MKTYLAEDVKININELKSKFPALTFKPMGSLSKYPNSSHYHISSTEYRNPGIVEVTFFNNKGNPSIEVKLTSNRIGTWGNKGFDAIKEYITK